VVEVLVLEVYESVLPVVPVPMLEVLDVYPPAVPVVVVGSPLEAAMRCWDVSSAAVSLFSHVHDK
jgi:hypothetical protein